MTAAFWVPGPLPALNEIIKAKGKPSWSDGCYTKLKKRWTDDVWKLAKAARLPAFPGRVVIEWRWLEKNKRRDPDNVAAGGRKLVLDGLVAAGVLQGDGWKFVQSWTDRFDVYTSVPLAREPGVAVTLHSYEGAVLL